MELIDYNAFLWHASKCLKCVQYYKSELVQSSGDNVGCGENEDAEIFV